MNYKEFLLARQLSLGKKKNYKQTITLKKPHSIYISTGEHFIDFIYTDYYKTVLVSSKVLF